MAAPKLSRSRTIKVFADLAAELKANEILWRETDFNGFSTELRQWPPKSGSSSRPLVITKFASEETTPDLSHAIALAVRALAETKSEKKEVDKGFAERLERLQNEIARLSNDILTGQGQLPLEIEQERRTVTQSVREAEQRPRTEDHAIKFLLRLKATLPELDENTGGEILRGLMDSLDEFAKSTILQEKV